MTEVISVLHTSSYKFLVAVGLFRQQSIVTFKVVNVKQKKAHGKIEVTQKHMYFINMHEYMQCMSAWLYYFILKFTDVQIYTS